MSTSDKTMFISISRTCQKTAAQTIVVLVSMSVLGFYMLWGTPSSPEWLSQSMDVTTKIKRFLDNWCQVRDLRTNWKQIITPCEGNMKWADGSKMSGKRTDAMKSEVAAWDIRPAGEFSKLWIRARSENGKGKHFGGDSWRARLKGPSSPVVSIFDLRNGTYEVTFLPMEHGNYRAAFYLEHTLCEGLKDPPVNWFIKGNAQGKNQKHGILGSDNAYIGKQLGGEGWHFNFEVPRQMSLTYIKEMAKILFGNGNVCSEPCNLLWDGYGCWLNKTWEPYKPGEDHKYFSDSWPMKKNGILWFYGDSVMEQFYINTVKNGKLCQGFTMKCGHTYNWVYEVEGYNITAAKLKNDNLDFNDSKVLNEFENVLSTKGLEKPDSVLIFNFGLHFAESTNFSSFRTLIDKVINLIETRRNLKQLNAQLIWRTTTALNRHKLRLKHQHMRRFLTYQRAVLFNTYATWKMCRSGIFILDAFPMTDSYPFGTGRKEQPNDAVHYEHTVFRGIETLLYYFLQKS